MTEKISPYKKLLYFCFSLSLVAIFIVKKYKRPSTLPSQLATIIVGTNAEYPPFTFIKQDTFAGFDIELIQEIVRRLGKTIEFRDMPFTTLLPQLQVGSIHVIAAGMTPTQERSQQALFTKPYLKGTYLVALMPHTPEPPTSATIFKYLKNKRVIVNDGFVSDSYLEDKGITTRKVATIADAFMALRSKQVDVFVVSPTVLEPFFKRYGTKEFETIPLPDTQEPTALLISKNYPELFKEIQITLDAMEQDGSLENLRKRWKLS